MGGGHETQRRDPPVPPEHRYGRGAPGPHGRAVLGTQGCRRVSVPKGEYDVDEEPEAAARREFTEELGLGVPSGELLRLGDVTQSGGKVVTAWALEADLEPRDVTPGTFEMEWPPGSGRLQLFPEVDRVEWLDLDAAAVRIVRNQRVFLDRLATLLS